MNRTNYEIGVQINADSAKGAARNIGTADAALNKFGASANSASGALSSFAGNVGAAVFTKIASSAYDAGAAVLGYSARMEQTKIGFETLIGNAQLAQNHLRDLQRFGAETPFEFEGLAKASQRLQSVGVNAEIVIPLLKDIGNVAAATGDMSTERIEGITTAISQMISKTKVSAEEMEQLAERGVPAWKILADATGKSQQQLRKLSEQGQLSSEIMVTALQKISREKYGDAMQKQSKTFNGAISNIKDTVLIASTDAFEPYYNEIAKFSVRMADEIQAQDGDLKKIGNTIAGYVGEGVGIGMAAVGEVAAAKFSERFSEMFTQGRIIDPITASIQRGIGTGLIRGLGASDATVKGFKKGFDDVTNMNWLFGDSIGANVAPAIKAQFAATRDAIIEMNAAANELPDIAAKLKAAEAEKETKALNDVIQDLSTRIEFFGNASEVASVKQKLIGQGIKDFNSDSARAAISLARTLDNLKESQQKQEEYNKSLKDAREHLRDLRNGALFNITFPKATELQKFDSWVKNQASNFRSLKGEIDATRSALRLDAYMQGLNTQIQLGKDGIAGLDRQIENLNSRNFSEIESAIADLGRTVGIEDALSKATDQNGVNVTLAAFTQEIKKYIDVWNNFLLTGDVEAKQKAEKSLRDYLNSFELTLETMEGDVKKTQKFRVFTDAGIDKAIGRFRGLAEATSSAALQEGTEKLDEKLKSLNISFAGLGVVSAKDEITKFLSDPKVTLDINNRAKAIGMTNEELKEQFRLRMENAVDPRSTGTRQRKVPGLEKATEPRTGFWKGVLGEREQIESEAKYIEGVYEDLGDTALSVMNDMIGAGAQLLEQWILTGDAGGAAMAQFAASTIASVASQAGVKAIFEYAEGVAAAARYDPVSAAGHFTAAKIYGVVSLSALGTGLAIGAAGGLQGGGGRSSQSDSPDYQTANGNFGNLRTTNQNLLTSPRTPERESNRALVNAIENLDGKLRAMKPGEVLSIGTKQNRGLISEVTIKEIKGSSSKKKELGKAMNLK